MSVAKIRREALKQLEDKYGRVTAQKLVDAARNPKHPLHGDFEWDDRKAGQHYRLDQARAIISSVRVVTTISNKKFSCAGYLRDPAVGREQGHRHVTRIADERDTAIEALLYETTRAAAILERAAEIAVVLGLQDEFTAAMEGVAALQSRAKNQSRNRRREAVREAGVHA